MRPGGVFLRSRKRKSEIEVERAVSCREGGEPKGDAESRERGRADRGQSRDDEKDQERDSLRRDAVVNEDEAEPSARAVGPKMD